MPKTQTLGDMLKLGDLPLEQKEQISDAIRYSAEHEGEFYSEVNHEKLDANKTSMTFIRSYLPKIDKNSERYKNGLVEGITPDPEQINEAEFSVSVSENGWYYKFTNKAVNHAWLDIKARCSKFLGNIFKTYHDEKIADAYLSSANVVTNCDLTSLKDLLALNTILYKNGAQTFNGFYKLKVAPEVADAMLVVFKDIITHTTEKNAIVQGEIGEIAGFRVIKSRLQAFAYANGKSKFVAYGKTMKGEYPVSICAYDNMAESVMLTPLGGLGNDPLKQRGAIGLYVDGHGFYVFDDAICVTGECASVSANVSAIATSANDFTGDNNLENRHQLRAVGGAREIVPQFDYIAMHKFTTSSTATTVNLKCAKADGSAWATSGLTFTSGNQSVATVTTGGVVSAVGKGVASIVIKSKANDKIMTIVTVEVVDDGEGGVIEA